MESGVIGLINDKIAEYKENYGQNNEFNGK